MMLHLMVYLIGAELQSRTSNDLSQGCLVFELNVNIVINFS